MQQVNLLIKPASSLCNMRCRYCFYTDETAYQTDVHPSVMSMDTADCLIARTREALDTDGTASFSFQGGEPTLAGLPFFRHFVNQVNATGMCARYAIQTNGLAITPEWISFFKENQFLVGISIDGDASTHDQMRPDAAGQPTSRHVLDSIRMLQDAGIPYNLLCVVNRYTAAAPKQTFRYLRTLGQYLQFIPCLDPLDAMRGSMPWSLTPEDYGRFLCETFETWLRSWRSGRYVSVRFFDDIIHLAMGQAPSSCACSGTCGETLVIEADGSVYPCDFYALDEWKLGTLQSTFDELLQSPGMNRFKARSLHKPAACQRCPFFTLCRGGCPRDWTSGPETANYYCSALQTFFKKAESGIAEIAQAELNAMQHAVSKSF
ncbi:MAG: anaerobic sulfatase maturase [Clostridia bacterium]|nr:anaerobic sulfatase maturase [Clostridia bacterium]